MCRKKIFLALLSTLGFRLFGLEHSVVNAQSTIAATSKLSPQRTEAQTLKQGTAQRRVGEPSNSFLRRVLPISFPSAYNDLVVAYTWRPTPFGKQLFFSKTNGGDEEYDLILFVLDPFQANTYAVQAFNMGNMGDLTTVSAVFFADVDYDGRKELLSLNECDLREMFKVVGEEIKPIENGEKYNGETTTARVPHYETHVFKYAGTSNDGRPKYQEDLTPRPYLDELPTAAAIRQAITRHQRKTAKPKR